MKEFTCVFVYGTLREGECNHGLLAGCERVGGRAELAGWLWDTGCGYPALTPADPADAGAIVVGELYLVPAERLAELDLVEDYYGEGDPHNEYERIWTPVRTNAGTALAWAYIYPSVKAHGLALIASGDWVAEWRREQ